MYKKEDLYGLWDFLIMAVLAEGGDGDAWVISEHYEEYADFYQSYITETNNTALCKRNDNQNMISFSGDSTWSEEYIVFLKHKEEVPSWAITVLELKF